MNYLPVAALSTNSRPRITFELVNTPKTRTNSLESAYFNVEEPGQIILITNGRLEIYGKGQWIVRKCIKNKNDQFETVEEECHDFNYSPYNIVEEKNSGGKVVFKFFIVHKTEKVPVWCTNEIKSYSDRWMRIQTKKVPYETFKKLELTILAPEYTTWPVDDFAMSFSPVVTSQPQPSLAPPTCAQLTNPPQLSESGNVAGVMMGGEIGVSGQSPFFQVPTHQYNIQQVLSSTRPYTHSSSIYKTPINKRFPRTGNFWPRHQNIQPPVQIQMPQTPQTVQLHLQSQIPPQEPHPDLVLESFEQMQQSQEQMPNPHMQPMPNTLNKHDYSYNTLNDTNPDGSHYNNQDDYTLDIRKSQKRATTTEPESFLNLDNYNGDEDYNLNIRKSQKGRTAVTTEAEVNIREPQVNIREPQILPQTSSPLPDDVGLTEIDSDQDSLSNSEFFETLFNSCPSSTSSTHSSYRSSFGDNQSCFHSFATPTVVLSGEKGQPTEEEIMATSMEQMSLSASWSHSLLRSSDDLLDALLGSSGNNILDDFQFRKMLSIS